jgi:putative membrane protein
MSTAAQAVLASWSFPPYVTAINLVTVLMYFRGWRTLRAAMPERFTAWRLISFVGGIAALETALASPIDTFDPFLLCTHMLQHMILMMLVPPLFLLGDPAIPLLHGMPLWASRDVLGPIISWPPLQRLGRRLTHPAAAGLLMALAMLGWHIPAAYEFALSSSGWHEIEHACFLVTSLLFWWPVVQPWPSHPQWPRWTMPLYLLFADFVNSALSAFLTFSGRVLYPWYALVPRLGGISAQNDQVAAGVSMWVIGSFAFLIPAVIITARLLSPSPPERELERNPVPPETRLSRYMFLALMLSLPLAALAYGWLAPDTIDTDGAVVRMQEVSGPFRVSVFSAPGPLPAGAADVSVLVQDRNSGETILDATVDLEAQPVGGGGGSESIRATRSRSTNKLLEAATLNLSSPGSWELRISVQRGSDHVTLSGRLEVATIESPHDHRLAILFLRQFSVFSGMWPFPPQGRATGSRGRTSSISLAFDGKTSI